LNTASGPVADPAVHDTGYTTPLDPDLFREADLLVHDATFLDPDDRAEPLHATTGEAIAAGRDAGAARLVLQHLSVRYDREEAMPRIRQQVRQGGYEGECWLLDGAELLPVAARPSLPRP
jgi:ribonuclease BN (tRNA processing enzyme)